MALSKLLAPKLLENSPLAPKLLENWQSDPASVTLSAHLRDCVTREDLWQITSDLSYMSCMKITNIAYNGGKDVAPGVRHTLIIIILILKTNDFHYIGVYVFTRRVSLSNVYSSVIHGKKIKQYLSVAWNWYHWVAIAI